MSNGRHGSGKRQAKTWAAIPAASNSVVGNTTAIGGGLAVSVPTTVIWMLGEYTLSPDAAPTAQDACEISVVIGVFSMDAFTLGGTAMPDPGSEPEFPWLYWASHTFFFATMSADPNSVATAVRRSFDVRSMRKMKDRESLGYVFQYFDIAGAPAMQVELSTTRVLMGLH